MPRRRDLRTMPREALEGMFPPVRPKRLTPGPWAQPNPPMDLDVIGPGDQIAREPEFPADIDYDQRYKAPIVTVPGPQVVRLTVLGSIAPATGDKPQVITRPYLHPTKIPTRGIGILLKPLEPTDPGTSATSNAGGFQVTVYWRNPLTFHWGATNIITGIDYNQWWTTHDFQGGELWFEFDNVLIFGSLFVHVIELA